MNNETPKSDSTDDHYTHEETDSTKSRRLTDDYDTTKNGIDNKYQGKSSEHQNTNTTASVHRRVIKLKDQQILQKDKV